MKVNYKPARRVYRTEITDLEKQVVVDFLTDKISFSQALEALGYNPNHSTSFYSRTTVITRRLVRDGDIVIKREDF